jgi:hypothetical protein
MEALNMTRVALAAGCPGLAQAVFDHAHHCRPTGSVEESGMEIYRDLQYPHLREAHDRIYFGAWRGSSPTLGDLVEARRQVECFLDALEGELRQASPPGARQYLAKAWDAYRQGEPESAPGPAVLLAINNALSYGHRVLDRLLRAKGEANHVSRAFAGYYDASGDGDE